MFFHSTLLAVLALASSVTAQPSPTAYVEPTVPTGKPIAGDYRGALRPQIHFSPPKDFMVSVAIVPALGPVLNNPPPFRKIYFSWGMKEKRFKGNQ